MKIEPRLPQLPSLSELLEHPRVKGLVARVNRSTLAQRAGGFLEEMRASLAERAGRVEIPSLTQLAERLARRVLGEPATMGAVINATGLVLGDDALAPPLYEPALHAIVQLGGEYHRSDAAIVRQAERELADLAGAEAAHLTHSFDGALTLALAATAGNREALICGAAEGGIDWRWIAARAGVVPTFLPAPSPSAGRVGEGGDASPGSQSPRGQNTPQSAPPHPAEESGRMAAIIRAPNAEGVDFSSLVGDRIKEVVAIDAAPIAGTIDPSDHGFQSVETIQVRLKSGAEIVVVDGSGLLGGPRCGIVFGPRRLIEQLAEHPLASLSAVSPLVAGAFLAVLKAYRDDATMPVVYQLPVWQLLTAPLVNLEQRALRLSAIMADAASLSSAEAREVESTWRQSASREWAAKSWVIELQPAAGDSGALVEQLAQGPYPILARRVGAAVHLDLRTVFPRWDQQLVAAVRGVAGAS